jgi:hypothetical protein
MRKFVPFVVAAMLAGAVPAVAAEDQSKSPSATTSVVRVEHVAPAKRRVVRRSFRPWAHPSRGQVREIIRVEARRWKIDPRGLARRIACESRFSWWASNGSYHGLLQFAHSTFHRGVRTLRDRRVRLVRSEVRKARGARVVHYSDGHTERRPGARRRQRVFYVYKGKLPRRPELLHGWTQVRIGAQAIRGVSAVRSGEWACSA